MEEYPQIPERVSSLLSKATQSALLQQRQRSISAISRLSEVSQMTSVTAVSDFLEAKVASLQAELDHVKCEKSALDEIRDSQHLTESQFVEELEPYLARVRSKTQELRITKRQGRTFAADMEEEVGNKRQRTASPDIGLVERAYQAVLVQRVMSASAKQKGRKFSQSKFRKDVINYYSPEPPTIRVCMVPYPWAVLRECKSRPYCPQDFDRRRTRTPFRGRRQCL
ncbi:hypothetical protein BJY00DRAFT_106979 [Aspergillus carlsbadensis]|nr:hypothetical protein BJY00DRAFT_106979 [Aspergillus carlsbadensis]